MTPNCIPFLFLLCSSTDSDAGPADRSPPGDGAGSGRRAAEPRRREPARPRWRLFWQDLMLFWQEESAPIGRRRGSGAGPRRDLRSPWWQDLIPFWQKKSAPRGPGRASGESGRGADYKTCRRASDGNDKYSSNSAMLYLAGCLRRGPDAIWR